MRKMLIALAGGALVVALAAPVCPSTPVIRAPPKSFPIRVVAFLSVPM